MVDIWHDEEGVWAEAGTGVLGPFADENLAERAFATVLISNVSAELAARTDDDNAQGWAADLNLALEAIQ